MRLFFLIFVAVPLLEIYFLIKVGGQIGGGLTILLVLFTALVGLILVRAQGFATLFRVQTQLARGKSPALEMFEGLLLLVAGVLLLIPGFFTDALGFILLFPPWRRRIINWVIQRPFKYPFPGGRIFTQKETSYSSHNRMDGDGDGQGTPSDQTSAPRVIDVDHKKSD